jgi:hypothetical protein
MCFLHIHILSYFFSFFPPSSQTWYRAFSGSNGTVESDTFSRRAKLVFAGAIISAIASLWQLMTLGVHDEKASWEERVGRRKEGEERAPEPYMPTSTTAPATFPATTMGTSPGPIGHSGTASERV